MSGNTIARGLRQSSEYRANHVNDECSEAAVPLPALKKGTQHANVSPQTPTAKEKQQMGSTIFIFQMKKKIMKSELLTKIYRVYNKLEQVHGITKKAR